MMRRQASKSCDGNPPKRFLGWDSGKRVSAKKENLSPTQHQPACGTGFGQQYSKTMGKCYCTQHFRKSSDRGSAEFSTQVRCQAATLKVYLSLWQEACQHKSTVQTQVTHGAKCLLQLTDSRETGMLLRHCYAHKDYKYVS